MYIIRLLFTLAVVAVAYVAETYASAHASVVKATAHATYDQFQKWQSDMHVIQACIPLAALILIIVIWYEPIKRIIRKDKYEKDH